MTNTETLYRIFRLVFGVETVSDATTKRDIPEWNSMQTINLVLAIEETFHVELTPEDAATMLSVELIKDILREKGVDFDRGR